LHDRAVEETTPPGEGDDEQTMRLFRVLEFCQQWMTAETQFRIGKTCGEPGNLKCNLCEQKFSITGRSRAHAP